MFYTISFHHSIFGRREARAASGLTEISCKFQASPSIARASFQTMHKSNVFKPIITLDSKFRKVIA